jgi:LPXTG-motif cell wall-anchored protein
VWLLLFAAFGCMAVIGVVLYRRKRKEAQDEE